MLQQAQESNVKQQAAIDDPEEAIKQLKLSSVSRAPVIVRSEAMVASEQEAKQAAV